MKTKIKDAIVEYFKSQFKNRKDINLTTSDLADICYDGKRIPKTGK